MTMEQVGLESGTPAAGSAATKMLLAADGSTTVLLEAWFSTDLSTVIDFQGPRGAIGLAEEIRDALGLVADEPVIERFSRLITPEGEVMSVNRVILSEENAGLLLPPPGVPIGHHLARNGLSGTRRMIDAGDGRWNPGNIPCSRKEYVISCNPRMRIYVHERFNPLWVPAPEPARV
ncbi:hypothetical protein AMK26_33450 [Streptomyces sp. CB03234]|uniref:hypothetical protein n=1 Tax=Streptomyces sp. (strain CB03234) TaxID=1703937 RepID=UPI000939CA21|nr:hypothetical protein [Streptomyces sp. CB03234]OKJ94695.1 hypothetical protein AMK26_33450 [Streptomyces sp. CB03234]